MGEREKKITAQRIAEIAADKEVKRMAGEGYKPPFDLDAEMAVIGAMLIDQGATGIVFQHMKSSSPFYDSKHQIIFDAVVRLDQKGSAVDMITVAQEINTMKLSEAAPTWYVMEVAQKVSSTAHIEHHIAIVKEKHAMRRVNHLGHLLLNRSFDAGSTAENILETVMSIIDKELAETSTQTFDDWDVVLQNVVKDVERLSLNDGIAGIPTGFSHLDHLTGGWQGSNLYVLAARPGMGKTALVVKFMIEAAKAKTPVAICQLEMADVQFAKRIVANEAATLHANQLYKHGIRDDGQFKQFMDVVGSLIDLPITVIPQPGMTVFECRMEARKLHRSPQGLGMLIVDYLQLMGGSSGGNREQEISQISRELKKLSNELNIPVIALSQLSRAVEARSNKRPQLSDLRESGAIEQDADMVLFLYRPEYYNYSEWIDGERAGESCEGQAEINVAKHRNGGLGTVVVGFDDNRVKFHDFEPFVEKP